jgi:hypothetical protein
LTPNASNANQKLFFIFGCMSHESNYTITEYSIETAIPPDWR